MNQEVRVPQLPESIADATLISWNKSVGDSVADGDILAELETDKVVLEVPAVCDGFLAEISAREGQSVGTGDLLAIISENAVPTAEKPLPPEGLRPPSPAENKTHFNPSVNDALPSMSPSARRLVKELNLDPRTIRANDGSGTIHKSDVLHFVEDREEAHQTNSENTQSTVSISSDDSQLTGSANRVEQRVPMTRLRSRIAERLRQAQENAVMLTTFNEVNLSTIIDVRNHYREDFEKAHGVRLGLMSFFVKAAVEALQRFPIINAAVDGQDIIYHGYYDIGVAVSSNRGLVVPILRDCDQLQMHEIEQQIRSFSAKAQDGSLSFEDLNGGTFSITNGGVFGSLMSTPILNPPQSAILGMHKIMQRPIVKDGNIIAAPMMYLALTYDHRIVDGKDAVRFLATIKDALEEPTRLLLKL